MQEKKIGIPLEGFAEFSRVAAAEGAVLLKNDRETLPIKKGEKVSVFGRTQVDYYRSGTGSGGSVNVEYTTNLLDGLRNFVKADVNEELAAVYEKWIEENPFDNGGGAWAAEPWHQKEMPLSEEVVRKAAENSDKALIVFGRTAGEDQDNEAKEGSYCLSEEERQVLRIVTRYFEKTAVILNVSNIMDMSWLYEEYKNPITAVLYSWHGGIEGGNATAQVICGQVTPSGKLPDTVADAIEDYPSTRNHGSREQNVYQEDIYVGYRYFETFCPDKVRFPFGFGLSYTNFSIENLNAELVEKEGKSSVIVTAKVRNTGDVYSGKEVVQVYVQAPQGKLGRPARELIGFAKTGLLAPHEEETVKIEIPLSQMAAYDDSGVSGHKSCYILEEGIYYIHVGNSVRDTERVTVQGQEGILVENTCVVEELEEAAAPSVGFERMKPGEKKADGTYELCWEKVPVKTVDLLKRIQERLPEERPITGNVGIRFRDVKDGKASLDDFVAQFSREDLAAIVRGEGMCSPKVTPGVASCFGGISDHLLEDFGLPIAATSDGPSGIRMDVGAKATQVPIGTLLASTWNLSLIEELYVMEGKELLRNEIDSLLGPGVNIHRNPLNGRNFEYFSEDPLLTGRFAAAMVRGIHKGGSGATVKHFACNSQETCRNHVNAVVSERALREIYLKGFELAVKEGGANSIMTSYNPVNGYWSASNYDLNTTILRGEWGYQGIVMTDWWATMNDVEKGGNTANRTDTRSMVRAQNDLYMVVNNFGAEVNAYGDNTLEALEEGTLTVGELQRCAKNICRFILNAPVADRELPESVPAKKMQASQERIEGAQNLNENEKLVVKEGKTNGFFVEKAGVYVIAASMKMDDTVHAQSACNILLNGKICAMGQTNGTNGESVILKLDKAELERGYYTCEIDYVKPGMEVEWLKFRPF